MKTLLLLAASLALAAAASADPKKPAFDVSGPATLVPGVSIGAFKLGMTRADIEKLGISFKTPASSVIIAGPYEIGLDKDDRVRSIARHLATDDNGKPITGAVMFAGKKIEPTISFADLQKRIPGCKAPEALIGGTVARCADHTYVEAAGPVGIVRLRVDR